MPQPDFSTPLNRIDAGARSAFGAYCDYIGSRAEVARRHDMNTRTVGRICKGDRDVPPRLAEELAQAIEADAAAPARLRGSAQLLRAWAKDCRQREDAKHG